MAITEPTKVSTDCRMQKLLASHWMKLSVISENDAEIKSVEKVADSEKSSVAAYFERAK